MSKREKVGIVSWIVVSIGCLIFMCAYDKCPTAQNLCQQACEEKYKDLKKPNYEIIGVDKGSDNKNLHCDCYVKTTKIPKKDCQCHSSSSK